MIAMLDEFSNARKGQPPKYTAGLIEILRQHDGGGE
jgi:hypothetical protein